MLEGIPGKATSSVTQGVCNLAMLFLENNLVAPVNTVSSHAFELSNSTSRNHALKKYLLASTKGGC